MKPVFKLAGLFVLLSLTSCVKQYHIEGNSTIPILDGSVLYLETLPPYGQPSARIDSCSLVHGRFSFTGKLDSVTMGALYIDDACVMPIVVEEGNIEILIDPCVRRVSGGVLNDRLYQFIERKNDMRNELRSLVETFDIHRQCPDKIRRKIQELNEQIERMDQDFITTNSDNILGPSMFMLLGEQMVYPLETPFMRHIIETSSPQFINHPYVRNFIRNAESNTTISYEINISTSGQMDK